MVTPRGGADHKLCSDRVMKAIHVVQLLVAFRPRPPLPLSGCSTTRFCPPVPSRHSTPCHTMPPYTTLHRTTPHHTAPHRTTAVTGQVSRQWCCLSASSHAKTSQATPASTDC